MLIINKLCKGIMEGPPGSGRLSTLNWLSQLSGAPHRARRFQNALAIPLHAAVALGASLLTLSSCYFGDPDIPAPDGSEPNEPGTTAVTGVMLDKTDLKIEVGTYDYLTATVLPETAANKAVEWESSKPAVAIVNDDGQVSAIMQGSATITVTTKEGGFKATCDLLVVAKNSLHPYVEMGDGLKWASCNVGATKPQEYGDYFAWGETKPYYKSGHSQDNPCSYWVSGKTGYNWASYSLADGTYDKLKKYCNNASYGDGGYTDTYKDLQAADDAAAQNWQNGWRMPTDQEWTKLRNTSNFDWTWTENYNGTGVKGMIVTSKVSGYKGNSIFLPAAGYRNETELKKSDTGNYWSSSIYSYPYHALLVTFYASGVDQHIEYRCFGLPVRPVKK